LVNQRVQCQRKNSSTSSLLRKLLRTEKSFRSGKSLRKNSKKLLQTEKLGNSLRRNSKRLRRLTLTNLTLMSQSCLRHTCYQMLLRS
jgi:hypothetical protein